MLLLVIDTETTGLDPKTDSLIEFAAALYSVEERTALWTYATLVPDAKRNPVVEINCITDRMLALMRPQLDGGFSPVHMMLSHGAELPVTAICAHNAAFDRGFLGAAGARFCQARVEIPWVCTQTDIVYPRARGSQHLAHLAADHGLVAVQRHRALSDVLLLCDLLSCVDDLAEQVEAALKPRAAFEAIVSYVDREQAKNLGFGWSVPPGRTKKCWWRMLPADTPLEPTVERPFRLERIVEAD